MPASFYDTFKPYIGQPEQANDASRRLIRAALRGEGPLSLASALRVGKAIERLGGDPPAPVYRIDGHRCVPLRLGRCFDERSC